MNEPLAAHPSVEMVYLYYDNPEMLRVQLDCWNGYPKAMARIPSVILVDDGSPNAPAVEIVRRHGCGVPIRVFRIKEDIPWNFSGARNLGCHQANGWIYVSDIDTLLYENDAKVLFEDRPLEMGRFYMPRRVRLPDMADERPGIVNLLFHRETFFLIGGYDEDYAGHYGREETDFFDRIRRGAQKVKVDESVIRVMPPTLVPDACTQGRSRDRARNVALYERKLALGFPAPANPLRFSWERVL